jgi:methylmalonyl-CoA/ethylmalonyl-CoA epimerase
MIKNLTVHHIGYMVKDISKSRAAFEQLGFTLQTEEAVFDPIRICNFLFMDNGGIRVELIQPKDETSPVWNLLKRYRNTPYHICYEVNNIDAVISQLTSGAFILVQPPAVAPAIGTNAKVAFLMHADIGMIELLQTNG